MKQKHLFPILVMLAMLGCQSGYPGSMDDPQPQVKVVEVRSLNGTVEVADGIYDLEAFVRGTDGALLTIAAGDRKSATTLSSSVWKRALLRGIEVKGGKVAIEASALGTDASFTLQTAYLRQVSNRRTLITGGDMSMLSQVENNGGTFADADGKIGDCFELCAKGGMNLARLRLYNDPGNPANEPSNRFFAGIQDQDNILALAKRAKAAGMLIELTFHYSDFWTNGGEQYKPAAWCDYSLEQLKEAMYTYTRDFLIRMRDQGTAPEYVSLGNEIQSGILFGTTDANGVPTDSVNGYCSDMFNLASLLQQGAKAVREVCPDAKIIIHLTTSESITIDNFKWFFSAMSNANLDYDIIGASYYPFYGHKTIEQMIADAESLVKIYNKDFIFMEVGFAWNTTLEDGSIGQIADNKPYTDMTPQAQRQFMLDLAEQIAAGSEHLLGFIYWDPVYIAAPNCGWAAGEKNVTGNSTLFDFSGKMLPAWDAFRYNQ